MKANTNWNLGNFSVALSAEATPEMDQKLVNLGLLYLGQRVSEVDKILGGFEKKGDKLVRKAGWKRMDVEYTATLATALANAFEELELPNDGGKLECDVVVGQYVPTKAEPKFQREKSKFAEKESSEEGLEAWLKRFCGYEGPTHEEGGDEYKVEALAAAKLAIDEFLKKNI